MPEVIRFDRSAADMVENYGASGTRGATLTEMQWSSQAVLPVCCWRPSSRPTLRYLREALVAALSAG